ncbi:hypothetical protein [Candidatus Protochlamydia sp. W-9]|uniref:hypothetical protein n=1 Tax=Candidatus Protochlamydia sp. W-9 TaxID=1785087 RepID=UPI001178C9BF|nr:hypothetical protein [Candidatus Protochlamydia sp. W-9]
MGSTAQKKSVDYLKVRFEISKIRGCELIKVAQSTMRDKSHARENKDLKERIFQVFLKHKSFVLAIEGSPLLKEKDDW